MSAQIALNAAKALNAAVAPQPWQRARHIARQFPALFRPMGRECRAVFLDDPLAQGLLGPVAKNVLFSRLTLQFRRGLPDMREILILGRGRQRWGSNRPLGRGNRRFPPVRG